MFKKFKAVHNVRHDVLHIISPDFRGSTAEAEEVVPGVFIFFDEEDGQIVKVMIMDYEDRKSKK